MMPLVVSYDELLMQAYASLQPYQVWLLQYKVVRDTAINGVILTCNLKLLHVGLPSW